MAQRTNAHRPRRRSWRARPSSFNLIWLLLLAAVWGLSQFSSDGLGPLSLPRIGVDRNASVSFAMCGSLRRDDCVIDGDTFRFEGEAIRIMDIDAPETHPPRCDFEARLGAQASDRLRALLNEGPFVLRTSDRDEDRYGRKLRTVVRDGRSLGGVLVSEGLARTWTGRRQPWCG